MDKKRFVSTLIAIFTGVLTYIFSDEKRRVKLTQSIKRFRGNLFSYEPETLIIAGRPEEDHFENTKMVSEGSQFGVQYYNEYKQ
ncbi:hypothetical protein [Tenuibacillus multivorans]|uniref:Uncharacterized protein n=1 Tax=Tenuibacillus multivorans TaxID=237069 RepID=A0A1G9YAV6_9BACI|nr:hypothetical protein [Tenuibacillus multivorans]GEL76020.1 hypothetical protein TMU01_02550 [Tenuibacillus multivorans]SDN06192.1 hypothetical protein SAMN05216498_1316 [Tenuibacillus multivorans]